MSSITQDVAHFTASCTPAGIDAPARSTVAYRCNRILSLVATGPADDVTEALPSIVAGLSGSVAPGAAISREQAGAREAAAMSAAAASGALRAHGIVPQAADPLAEVPALAAAAALASARASTGSQVLDAVAVGVEVGLRLEGTLAEQLWGRGWQPGAVAGRIGAAAAAARMLHLTTEQTVVALGVAATQVAGFASASDTAAGGLATAKQAADGVEAALLAAAGFTAPADAIGGRRGLAAVAAGYEGALPVGPDQWGGRWSAATLPAAGDPRWAALGGDGSSWDLDSVDDPASVAFTGRSLLR